MSQSWSQSPEAQAMRETYSMLVDHIQDPPGMAFRLFSKGMLTTEQLEAVSATRLPREQRQTIVSAVYSQVQLRAAQFHKFVEVLKGEPASQILTEELEASYYKFKGQSNSQSHSNGTGTTPTSEGTTPTPVGATPTSAGTTPTPVGATPTSAGTMPTPVGATPTSAGTTPTPVGATPTSAGTTPTPVGATPTSAGRVQLSDILSMKPTNKEMTASFKYLDESGKKVSFRMWDELKQGGCLWDDLARQLDYGSEVASISETHRADPKKCYYELISSHWFKNGDDVTWGGFIETLEDMDCSQIADKLKKVLLTKVDKR